MTILKLFDTETETEFTNQFFFEAPSTIQPTTRLNRDMKRAWKKGRNSSTKKNIFIKQLRFDGSEFYLSTQKIPLPKIPSTWEKQRLQGWEGEETRDLMVQMVSVTETQVIWEVEKVRMEEDTARFLPFRFIIFDYLTK